MVKYKTTVSQNTFQMLDKHIFFLAKVSTKAAHSLRKTFVRTIKSLNNNPKRYPLWLPQFKLSKPYRNILINKRYLIIFYIDGNNIFVDYLLDCRMNNEKFF